MAHPTSQTAEYALRGAQFPRKWRNKHELCSGPSGETIDKPHNHLCLLAFCSGHETIDINTTKCLALFTPSSPTPGRPTSIGLR